MPRELRVDDDAALGAAIAAMLVDDAAREALIQAVAPLMPPREPAQKTTEPDFVWVGCNTCWQPADATRPVRAYVEWQQDPHRHRAFFCRTCSTQYNAHVEVFPTLWAFWLDDARPWREGGHAPASSDVENWGR